MKRLRRGRQAKAAAGGKRSGSYPFSHAKTCRRARAAPPDRRFNRSYGRSAPWIPPEGEPEDEHVKWSALMRLHLVLFGATNMQVIGILTAWKRDGCRALCAIRCAVREGNS